MQVLRHLATGAPLAEVLVALVRFIEGLAPGRRATVLLLDDDGRHLHHGAAPSLPAAYTAAIDGAAIGPGAGSCGTAAWRREPVVVEDIATDPLWADWRSLALAHGLRACWSSPIPDPQGRVLGTFAIYRDEPAQPDDDDRWLIDLATQAAAIAIVHDRTQATLRRQMGVLEGTLEHMDQGVMILDSQQRVVRTNMRLQEVLGYPSALCAAGTPFLEVARFNARRGEYGPGDPENLARERCALLARGEAHRFVNERPNGRVVDVRGAPLPDGGYVVTYTDASMRTHTERDALRFRAALDLSSDGIYLVDARTLRLLDVNEGACRALGHRREQLLGLGLEEIFADRDREQLQAEYDALAAGDDRNANFRAVHRRRDGSTFPVEINRRIHHSPRGPVMVGVARDVTLQQQAQQALSRSEEMLRAIIQDALDAAVRIDAEGRVVDWNRQAERCFGWRADEAMGRLLSALIVPERHRAAHDQGMKRFIATGQSRMLNRRIEMSAICRDGREIPVELSVTPVRTASGWLFSAFLRDLSAVRAGEAQRAALEAQLRDAQKMEAIGTLASGIAHDFNNIIPAIIGNTELARGLLPPGGGRALPHLAQVTRSAERARSLVQQILAFSRRERQQRLPLALAPLVNDGLAMLRALLPAGVALQAHIDQQPALWVQADATRLQQVLMNLCTNAWHALQGRAGCIEVGLAPAEREGRPLAHLWVRDDGVGMDEATRQRIFEPFFTTKEVGQGTGLGLAVVHGIVAAHDGLIEVDSQPGRGSCFHVLLPLTDSRPGAVPPSPPGPAAGPGAGRRVLCIDDDEAMLALVSSLLERDGWQVLAMNGAAPALALLRQDPQAVDIVVTDFNMPGESGLHVAREVARLRPGLPVVLSSGFIDEATQAEAHASGVRALLRKEHTLEELPALLRRLLAPAG